MPIAILITSLFLVSCAASEVTRDVSSGIDMGLQNSSDLAEGAAEGSISDSYQNSTQEAKGAVIGGIAGGVVGAATTGIGTLQGTAIGLILGAAYGKYIDSTTTLEDRLINRGVNIIILGDQVLIVIPSARLFFDYSAQIKPSSYSTLDMVTCFMNRYVKTLVKIKAYTADTCTPRVSKSLSKHQADNVMRYFEANGLGARMLYAYGADGSDLVVSNCLGWDSDNYRIEITFEKLYV